MQIVAALRGDAALVTGPGVNSGLLYEFCDQPASMYNMDMAYATPIGLGIALDWMQALDWRAIQEHELRLTRYLLDGLMLIPGVRVLGPVDTHDRRGVISFSFGRFSAEEVCRHLDKHGVALRGGHHCAQPLVRAFGVDGAARASMAPYTQDVDIDALLNGLEELVRAKPRQLHRQTRLRTAK